MSSHAPSEAARTAVADLAREHAGLIHALGLRFCASASDAEDLVQEVFLNAYKGWDGFEGRSDVKTWLYRIAARACMRLQRKRAGEPRHIASLDASLPFDEPRVALVPDEGLSALDESSRRETLERTERAIASLPEEFRVALVLKDVVGLSAKEIATIMEVEEPTVRTRVHRARLKVREAVEKGLPRSDADTPPTPYPMQTCLDLLRAKQEALDKGVELDQAIICDRCRSVFGTLDLAKDACEQLVRSSPTDPALLERLERALREASGSEG
ncbi:MAG: hypothetical protein Tsb0013_05990 [Phycisphaerales bacterium]